MAIFEMVSSLNGDYFLAAEFEENIQVWKADDYSKLASFSTHFLGGGKRMAISSDGTMVAAANYHRFGISLYAVDSGKEIWTTKKIKRIQNITFSPDDSILYVVNNDEILYALSVSDGSVLSTKKDVKKISINKFGIIEQSYDKCVYCDENRLNNVSFIENTTIDLCRLPQGFCFSNMGNGLFCYNQNGRLLWKAQNNGESYGQLAYCQKYDYLLACGFKAGSYFVDAYPAVSTSKVNIPKYRLELKNANGNSCAFIKNGRKMITSLGEIYCFEETGGKLCEQRIVW